jgi:uncharacterized damage-inducible protein DinB
MEYWLSGPVENIPSLLQPVAHALLQSREEVKESVNGFPDSLLWQKPGAAASVGFHLQHLTGVLDRLFTYARGEQLNQQQLEYLRAEGKENESIQVSNLLDNFNQQVEIALKQLENTSENSLLEFRGVGRKQIPSNVIGLLFHAAEHSQRHTGQLLVTVKVLNAREMRNEEF